MEKMFKAVGFIILAIGAGMIVYPLLANLITNLDHNLFGAPFSILPLITFFWLTLQVNELEKSKKTIIKLRAHIKHNQ